MHRYLALIYVGIILGVLFGLGLYIHRKTIQGKQYTGFRSDIIYRSFPSLHALDYKSDGGMEVSGGSEVGGTAPVYGQVVEFESFKKIEPFRKDLEDDIRVARMKGLVMNESPGSVTVSCGNNVFVRAEYRFIVPRWEHPAPDSPKQITSVKVTVYPDPPSRSRKGSRNGFGG